MSEQTGPSPEDALLPHPAYSAMLICDMAIREEGTGKVSLIGIFENVSATVFPARHPLLCVYCKLTDAQGDYAFRLELVRAFRAGETSLISSSSLADSFLKGRVPTSSNCRPTAATSPGSRST